MKMNFVVEEAESEQNEAELGDLPPEVP